MTIAGQGTVPAAANVEKFAELGIKKMPGSGVLAAVVPGAFDAWMLLLAEQGTMRPRQVLETFIAYCIDGVPGSTHVQPRLFWYTCTITAVSLQFHQLCTMDLAAVLHFLLSTGRLRRLRIWDKTTCRLPKTVAGAIE
eukprot:SAG31_NODE_1311_length_8869_cov_10.603535_7_plen_138_part_00